MSTNILIKQNGQWLITALRAWLPPPRRAQRADSRQVKPIQGIGVSARFVLSVPATPSHGDLTSAVLLIDDGPFRFTLKDGNTSHVNGEQILVLESPICRAHQPGFKRFLANYQPTYRKRDDAITLRLRKVARTTFKTDVVVGR